MLSKDMYVLLVGILGSISSIIGLGSIVREPFNNSDFENVEPELLKAIAGASEEVKKLEVMRAQTKQEINDLELKKQEMAISVKRASLILFYREQLETKEARISFFIGQNQEIASAIKEVNDLKKKLIMLNEEIKTDPNIALIGEIIEKYNEEDDILLFSTQSSRLPFLLGKELRRFLTSFSKIMFKI